VAALTPVLAWAAFPPSPLPEAAFVLLLPALLWARRAPPWRLYALVQWVGWTAAWLVLLVWLRHVTWVGTVLLAGFLGGLTSLWFLAARAVLAPAAAPAAAGGRGSAPLPAPGLVALAGLAGLWVVLEWVRTWLFTGFPWLPLASTQWERPVMLASAPWAGAYGPTFLLALFNLGLAGHLDGLRRRREERGGWFSPSITLALFALVAGTFGLAGGLLHQTRESWARVGIVQPYIPQFQKWDEAFAREILGVLNRTTLQVAALEPDFILWPEAATPWTLQADPEMNAWVEHLAATTGRPLVLGAVVLEDQGQPTERWFNAAAIVDPERGLQADYYAKRHLVPFGEYVPLRPLFGWLRKVVPIGDDFQRGRSAAPLTVSGAGGPLQVGFLICYEDVFPRLARASANAGAEVLLNVTNNAWYGEGAAAYQHAAHSVLRAVELRRPVVRCGNGGWSGWIDEWGGQRAVLTDERGTVYFRGGEVVEVTRDTRWIGRQTFYARHGDWFVVVSAVLALAALRPVLALGAAGLRRRRAG
jgi:apolipoprotein N-acyltransferase